MIRLTETEPTARWCVECDALWLAGNDGAGAERPTCVCGKDDDWLCLFDELHDLVQAGIAAEQGAEEEAS